MTKLTFPALVILSNFVIGPAIEPAVAAPDVGRLEHRFDTEAAAHPVGGMTVGLVADGKLAWTKSYGFADAEGHVAANADTVYRIGSVTKQFTSIMLLQLAAAGKVKAGDAAQKYLPEIALIRGNAPPITLEQLAEHRAGLSREPDQNNFVVGSITAWRETMVAALPHTAYQFTPGTRVSYSNIGVAALGGALAVAAGEPYVDYVQRRIVTPLGMTHTSFTPDAALLAHLAKGYRPSGPKDKQVGDPTAARKELEQGRGYKIPNGGLFSTVGDLALFLNFEMGHGPRGVLAPETLSENFKTAYAMEDEPGWSYGRGFYKTVVNGQTILGHWGSVSGYAAAAYFDPDAQVGIVILRNSDPRVANEVIVEALQIAAGK